MTDLFLGTMTGTSADGIDLALIKTDGEKIMELGATDFMPFSPAIQKKIIACFGKDNIDPIESEPAMMMIDLHHQAIQQFLQKYKINKDNIIVGYHGQTIYHAPQRRMTCQLGDGALLAQKLQMPVAWQFRQKDVMMGGQGAPLMPLFHRALQVFLELPSPLVFINIGGVANITYLTHDNIYAGDVGPGNGLMDDYCQAHLHQPCDRDGRLAMQGSPNKKLVAQWLTHGFFQKPMPKSLDRQDFNDLIAGGLKTGKHGDNLATLQYFTTEAMVQSIARLKPVPKMVMVVGGGRHNPVLMQGLQEKLAMPMKNIDDIGNSRGAQGLGDFVEAYGFGFLSARVMKKLPLSLPDTTGVLAPTIGGVVSYP